MSQPITNLLLTGPPGCGKTTVIRRVVEILKGRRLAGFYTEELREHGQRLGFKAIGLGGGKTMLAHVDFRTRHRVGRYGVDLEGFEAIVHTKLNREPGEVDVIVVDEIGRMECMSPVFVAAITRVLDAPVPVLATIAANGGGFIAQVKVRSDVEIVTVTSTNRDQLPDELVCHIHSR
jgi:nucleoside-triphosphatase